MNPKRVTLFAGHYGSGKTNIAVNYALWLKSVGKEVVIADLDIVNPYFRTKDSTKELEEAGITLISPEFANSNIDLPALPSSVYGVVQNKSRYAVLDIGGDDRGAYALGRYRPYILEENDYEMVYVANFARPLTPDAQSMLEVMAEIEAACGIKFTAIVNNTNLAGDTTADYISESLSKAEELSRLTGLPILFTSVMEEIDMEGTFKLKLQKKYFDII